jgi:trehalose 6-phosphate phosphatase
MQILTSSLDFDAFLHAIPAAPARVLMLDYDGTLAPFQVKPELATPYPGVLAALEEVVRSGRTRLIIISGRPARDLVPLLPLTRRPEIWGSHGWERLLPSGELESEQPSPAQEQALAKAVNAVEVMTRLGARLERKPASVALHWRGLPALATARLQSEVPAAWADSAGQDLEILPFDGGLELRATGCNKQHAVKRVLSETPADSAVAFLGDDITDEDAFAAVKPRGIGVLVRQQFRPTSADVWLRPPRELLAFIRHWHD